jgi:hypothetical protein
MQESQRRPWQQIARELAGTTDRNRIVALSEELNRAMEEQASDPRADQPQTPRT